MDNEASFVPHRKARVNRFINENIGKITDKAYKIAIQSLLFWPYGVRSLLLAEKGLNIIKRENTGHEFRLKLKIAFTISLCEFLAIPAILLIGIIIILIKSFSLH